MISKEKELRSAIFKQFFQVKSVNSEILNNYICNYHYENIIDFYQSLLEDINIEEEHGLIEAALISINEKIDEIKEAEKIKNKY